MVRSTPLPSSWPEPRNSPADCWLKSVRVLMSGPEVEVAEGVAVTVTVGPGTVAVAVTVWVGPGTVAVAVTVTVAVAVAVAVFPTQTVLMGNLGILAVEAPLGANRLPAATRTRVITLTTEAKAVRPAFAWGRRGMRCARCLRRRLVVIAGVPPHRIRGTGCRPRPGVELTSRRSPP